MCLSLQVLLTTILFEYNVICQQEIVQSFIPETSTESINASSFVPAINFTFRPQSNEFSGLAPPRNDDNFRPKINPGFIPPPGNFSGLDPPRNDDNFRPKISPGIIPPRGNFSGLAPPRNDDNFRPKINPGFIPPPSNFSGLTAPTNNDNFRPKINAGFIPPPNNFTGLVPPKTTTNSIQTSDQSLFQPLNDFVESTNPQSPSQGFTQPVSNTDTSEPSQISGQTFISTTNIDSNENSFVPRIEPNLVQDAFNNATGSIPPNNINGITLQSSSNNFNQSFNTNISLNDGTPSIQKNINEPNLILPLGNANSTSFNTTNFISPQNIVPLTSQDTVLQNTNNSLFVTGNLSVNTDTETQNQVEPNLKTTFRIFDEQGNEIPNLNNIDQSQNLNPEEQNQELTTLNQTQTIVPFRQSNNFTRNANGRRQRLINRPGVVRRLRRPLAARALNGRGRNALPVTRTLNGRQRGNLLRRPGRRPRVNFLSSSDPRPPARVNIILNNASLRRPRQRGEFINPPRTDNRNDAQRVTSRQVSNVAVNVLDFEDSDSDSNEKEYDYLNPIYDDSPLHNESKKPERRRKASTTVSPQLQFSLISRGTKKFQKLFGDTVN